MSAPSLPLDRIHRVLDPRIRRAEADTRRRRPSAREVLDELQAVRRELVGAPLRRYDRQLELDLRERERERERERAKRRGGRGGRDQ